ncbi:MAG: OsmC family protein [Acidimicrobiia bacterium]|nr:OsmC family protein [Acidimicrobiia bacterium]
MATEVAGAFDLTEAIVRRKMLTAVNHGGMMTEMDFGEYGYFATDEPTGHGGTGEGPSPLQTVLGALCGCESVTFNRTAAEMDFEYEKIEFVAEFTIDIRGRLGARGVTQHFRTVRVEAVVTTHESPERLSEVVEETEARCPVFNLMTDAGVNMEVRWSRNPTR